jgi:hypothetical protein
MCKAEKGSRQKYTYPATMTHNYDPSYEGLRLTMCLTYLHVSEA